MESIDRQTNTKIENEQKKEGGNTSPLHHIIEETKFSRFHNT